MTVHLRTLTNAIVNHEKVLVETITPHPELVTIYTIVQQTANRAFMERFGITKPVTLSYRTDYLLDGFLEAQTAMSLGIDYIDAIYLDLTPAEEVEFVSTVNSIIKATIIDKDKLDEIYSETKSPLMKKLADLNILPLEGTKLRKRRTKIFEETEFVRENTVKGRNTVYRIGEIVIYGPTVKVEQLANEMQDKLPLKEELWKVI